MSYDIQIFLLAAAILINLGITWRHIKELKRLKRIEKYFDLDDEDYGEGIE